MAKSRKLTCISPALVDKKRVEPGETAEYDEETAKILIESGRFADPDGEGTKEKVAAAKKRVESHLRKKGASAKKAAASASK